MNRGNENMTGQITIEEQIGISLREKGWKLATAESCTGGLIGHLITNIPGSSDYYVGGVISYSNDAKIQFLHVKQSVLMEYGAVSRQTVIEMASGVRLAFSQNNSESTIGLAVTGIAGPGGGTPDKPVGLVWIGLSTPHGDWAWKYIWNGSRIQNKQFTARKALKLTHKYLQSGVCPETETFS
jgi:PncC family amidohydrolase